MIDDGPRKAISGGRSGRVISDDLQAERTLARCRLCGPSEWPGCAGLLRLTLGTAKILCLGGGGIFQSPPGRSDLESFSHVVKLIGWLLASLFVDAILGLFPWTLLLATRFFDFFIDPQLAWWPLRRPAVGGHGCREEGCRTKSVFILDVDRIPPSGAGWVCLFSH